MYKPTDSTTVTIKAKRWSNCFHLLKNKIIIEFVSDYRRPLLMPERTDRFPLNPNIYEMLRLLMPPVHVRCNNANVVNVLVSKVNGRKHFYVCIFSMHITK